jgi:hypothetical protein
VQVWGWQAQAGTPPRLLASLPRLHSPPKGSGLPLGLPLGLLPLPGDAPGELPRLGWLAVGGVHTCMRILNELQL